MWLEPGCSLAGARWSRVEPAGTGWSRLEPAEASWSLEPAPAIAVDINPTLYVLLHIEHTDFQVLLGQNNLQVLFGLHPNAVHLFSCLFM